MAISYNQKLRTLWRAFSYS